jgi:NifB/MoaA-like Fe-S oxidoreductase
MGRLMGQVTVPLVERTGATFEVITLANPLFGPSVTTAALLPGRAFQTALAARRDLDLALLPAEAVNDDGRFMDDLTVEDLVRSAPCEIRLSYDFGDALVSEAAR